MVENESLKSPEPKKIMDKLHIKVMAPTAVTLMIFENFETSTLSPSAGKSVSVTHGLPF